MMTKNIANYAVTENLRNGHAVTIRAIRADDKGAVAEALHDMSPESMYRRTFAPKRDLSDKELDQLTRVDFENVVALVAVMTGDGTGKIVGGGRYIRIPGAERAAEVAFLVDDSCQGMGIGSRIFRHLVLIATASGIVRFEAEVLPSNKNMLRLFSRSGLPVQIAPARESVHVLIALNS